MATSQNSPGFNGSASLCFLRTRNLNVSFLRTRNLNLKGPAPMGEKLLLKSAESNLNPALFAKNMEAVSTTIPYFYGIISLVHIFSNALLHILNIPASCLFIYY